MQNESIYVFIDSQNLNLSIRDQGWKLDFKKFYIYLKDKYRFKKIFLFIGYIKNNEKLYIYLKNIGYTIIYKPTIANNESKTKGNVDAELVLHSMIEINNYSKFIIISGDGDFYCLIEYLLGINKFYKLIIPNKKKYSSLLRKFLNSVLFLSDKTLKNKLKQ